MVVPAGGGGTFLGGYIVKRLNLRCRGIIRFCIVCALSGLVTIIIFLVHCPDTPMAGITAEYQTRQMDKKHLYESWALDDQPSKLPLINRWGPHLYKTNHITDMIAHSGPQNGLSDHFFMLFELQSSTVYSTTFCQRLPSIDY